MNIFVTFDYELYFGKNSGTATKCLIEPGNYLLKIARKNNCKFTYFVDIGYIIQLKRFCKSFPQLQKDLTAISNQLDSFVKEGNELQLHIHPHWEDSYWDGEKWIFDVRRYKLSDFTEKEAIEIIGTYKNELSNYTSSNSINAFRAGGWCIQPWQIFKQGLIDNNIYIDSSVYAKGKFSSQQYSYDFSTAPTLGRWTFEDDPTLPSPGQFIEIPISSQKNSPLFFWELFLRGRINKYKYRPLGDGEAMHAPGYRKKLLTKFTHNPVSCDGYNASLLETCKSEALKLELSDYVILGHPKALSRFSLQALEQFANQNRYRHNFTTFAEQPRQQ